MKEKLIYVALDGSDENDGFSPSNEGGHGPFKTIERARNAVRDYKEKNAGNHVPVTVYIREGKHYLDKTVKFTSLDSGEADSPVTYAAYQGEKPVISGGIRVSGFTPYKDGIYMRRVDWVKKERRRIRQLFYKNERYLKARYPKNVTHDPLYSGWLFCEDPLDDRTDTIRFSEGDIPSGMVDPYQTEMFGLSQHGSYPNHMFIKSIDYENRVLELEHSGLQFYVAPWYQDVQYLKNARFYLENSLEMLTQRGEWCWDYENGILYFMPPETIGEKELEVVIPALPTLFDINGASHFNISGLTFTETDDGDDAIRVGAENIGAMYSREGWKYVGEALRYRNASYCRLEFCEFLSTGGNAIYAERENECIYIVGNKIHQTGANGVVLAGTHINYPRRCIVSDNYIRRNGVFNKYTAGIMLGYADNNFITHNLIENVPHHAINLNDSGPTRNYVEYNRIKWACEEIFDTGAVNCWMETPSDPNALRCGHIIRYNYISDIYGHKFEKGRNQENEGLFTNGLYMDNYTSNCVIYGNIIERSGHAGIMIHAGRNNLIENNVFYECRYGVRFEDGISLWSYWKSRLTGFMQSNVVVKNILVNSKRKAYMIYRAFGTNDRTVGYSDNNISWYGEGSVYEVLEKEGSGWYVAENAPITSMAQWNMQGYDQNSICADPLFVDPENGNFNFLPESPAIGLGIEAINAMKIGPRNTKIVREHYA